MIGPDVGRSVRGPGLLREIQGRKARIQRLEQDNAALADEVRILIAAFRTANAHASPRVKAAAQPIIDSALKLLAEVGHDCSGSQSANPSSPAIDFPPVKG